MLYVLDTVASKTKEATVLRIVKGLRVKPGGMTALVAEKVTGTTMFWHVGSRFVIAEEEAI